jgi:hypothetical protein
MQPTKIQSSRIWARSKKKDRKGGGEKGHRLNPTQRDESSQKADVACQGSQAKENNQSMKIGDESTAASADGSAKQTKGTHRPARGDSITPEPLDLKEQSGDPLSPMYGATYTGGA